MLSSFYLTCSFFYFLAPKVSDKSLVTISEEAGKLTVKISTDHYCAYQCYEFYAYKCPVCTGTVNKAYEYLGPKVHCGRKGLPARCKSLL